MCSCSETAEAEDDSSERASEQPAHTHRKSSVSCAREDSAKKVCLGRHRPQPQPWPGRRRRRCCCCCQGASTETQWLNASAFFPPARSGCKLTLTDAVTNSVQCSVRKLLTMATTGWQQSRGAHRYIAFLYCGALTAPTTAQHSVCVCSCYSAKSVG